MSKTRNSLVLMKMIPKAATNEHIPTPPPSVHSLIVRNIISLMFWITFDYINSSTEYMSEKWVAHFLRPLVGLVCYETQ
jgi:hypothetical protein